MPPPSPELRNLLAVHGQEHCLMGWEGLTEAEQAQYVAQLAKVDFGLLGELYRRKNVPQSILPSPDRIAPIPVEPVAASADERRIGESAIRAGRVAALLVAGGQGSRLGFDKPKGMFPIGPVSGNTLFQMHLEQLLALSRKYNKSIPLGIMTSPATDADTNAYFAENRYFGLDAGDVSFFEQGVMPALDLVTGKLLLEKPGQLFLSPNGHGGTLTALADSGVLAQWKQRGVDHVFYFQVDNPLIKICDPSFIGRHIARNSEASSKVVFKERAEEKVGILAVVDGRCGIIEYSDMPATMQAERIADGTLRYRAGSPAIHAFSIPFLERVTARGTGLTFHLARKKVPYFDIATGAKITPSVENALKFEMFVFDALPMADRWLAVETPRREEFAPLKNAAGADSPASVGAAIVALHSQWLERAGSHVPRNATGESEYPIEISPLFATDVEELKAKIPPVMVVDRALHLR